MIAENLSQRPDIFDINLDHPLAQGLVFAGLGAHAGSTRYHDSSAYGRSGSQSNMDSTAGWKYDTTLNRFMLNFDGSDEYVSLPIINLAGPAVSWSAWVRLSGANDTDMIIEMGTNFGTTTGRFTCYTESTVLTFGHRTVGNYNVGNVPRPSTGSLFHVCAVHNTTLAKELEISVFINGTAATVTKTFNNEGSDFISDIVYIGARAGTSLFLAMDIGDVTMYKRAMTTPEIQQLADPSNVMLSGLLLPPRRKWWPVVAGGGTPATFKAAWAARRRQVIGGGIS